MARLLRFAAVAVLVGGATAGLSGCTGDADPVASPSPSVTAESPSPTQSASPSPTALSEAELLELIPEDARAENLGAASNFAKFFVREYDVMFQTQDDALFRYMSGPDCEFCSSSLQTYADLIDAGGRRDGGDIVTTSDLATGGLNEDGYWYAGFAFEVTHSQDFDASEALVEEGPAGGGTAYAKLEFLDGRWIVQGVALEFVASEQSP